MVKRKATAVGILAGIILISQTAGAGEGSNPFQAFWNIVGSGATENPTGSGNIYGDSLSAGYAPEVLYSVTEGDYVTFGRFEQDGDEWNGPEQIEWLVVKKEENRALLLSRYGLKGMGPGGKWEDSEVREWMNGEFFESAFSEEEKALIPVTQVENPDTFELYKAWHGDGDGLVVGPNGLEGAVSDHGAEGGNATMDRVFALSYVELQNWFGAERYSEQNISWNERLICYPTEYGRQNSGTYGILEEYDYQDWYQPKGYPPLITGACEWITRSPGHDQSHHTYVTYAGVLDSSYNSVLSDDFMARPAIWIWNA